MSEDFKRELKEKIMEGCAYVQPINDRTAANS